MSWCNLSLQSSIITSKLVGCAPYEYSCFGDCFRHLFTNTVNPGFCIVHLSYPGLIVPHGSVIVNGNWKKESVCSLFSLQSSFLIRLTRACPDWKNMISGKLGELLRHSRYIDWKHNTRYCMTRCEIYWYHTVVSMNDNQDDEMNKKLVSSHQKLTYIENVPSRSLDIWKEATIRQREIHWYRPTFESCLYKLAEANTKSRNLCARGWLRWQFCIDKTSRWRCSSRTGNNSIKLRFPEIGLIDSSLCFRWKWPIQLSEKKLVSINPWDIRLLSMQQR